MKLARKILVKLLGLTAYLKFVSRTYIKMIRKGKMEEQYAELYFVSKIVEEGATIVDIGANLGYYSYFMAKNMGAKGRLLAIEPIPLFVDIWKKNVKEFENLDIEMFNCALGSEAKEEVTMSIPIVNGVVRHGLTRIDEGHNGEVIKSFKVPMKVGDELIEAAKVSKIDYIKCDVEGYEQFVIPSLSQTIEKYRPLFQIELGGEENRRNVADFLVKKAYDIFILEGDLLHPIQKNDIFSVNQDFYFIHKDNLTEKQHLIHK
jgi:FkbM family methyltransferase